MKGLISYGKASERTQQNFISNIDRDGVKKKFLSLKDWCYLSNFESGMGPICQVAPVG